jgi:hypothetical protein
MAPDHLLDSASQSVQLATESSGHPVVSDSTTAWCWTTSLMVFSWGRIPLLSWSLSGQTSDSFGSTQTCSELEAISFAGIISAMQDVYARSINVDGCLPISTICHAVAKLLRSDTLSVGPSFHEHIRWFEA